MQTASHTKAEDQWLPPLWRLAELVLVLLCLDFVALRLNIHSYAVGGVTILWPTNGLLLGVLLCTRRRQWPAYIAASFCVDIVCNMSLSFALGPSMYLASCNMLEATLAAVLLYRTISPKPDLTQRKQLLHLLFYGVLLAPAIASLCAQFNHSGARLLPLFTTFKIWFIADALGIAVMTPLYLSFKQDKGFSGRSRLEVAGLLAMLCVATVLVFWQTRFPLLFLLVPFLLLLGVRLRLAGSALGLLIIAIVGGYFTTGGRGPMMLIPNATIWAQDATLQFFIGTTMLMLYLLELVTSERERLNLTLQGSENRFRLLAEASNDIIVLSNLNGDRRYVSPAVSTLLGWRPQELIGLNYRQIVHPEDIEKVTASMNDCKEGTSVDTFSYRCRKKDGSYLWMEASIRLFRDALTGDASGFVNVVRDISARKAAEDEMSLAFRLVENLAMIDGLTGIANRRRFDEALDQELRRAMRDGNPVSLLMIDVDHFKLYNDLYGHVMGDSCLRQIAIAAQQIIHRTSDLLARYGGEEFVVILPNTDGRGALLIAEQIRSVVEQCRLPHLGNPHGVVTVSIGCASLVLTPESNGSLLLEAADQALYGAKSAGRNRIEIAAMTHVNS
jgi:diguanylate cyclase (GGDEF)-like protein/PAS domain S-box-containing protein